MSTSEMVQPTQGHVWEEEPARGPWPGLTRLNLGNGRKIVSRGTGPEVRQVIMAKMEERHGLSA